MLDRARPSRSKLSRREILRSSALFNSASMPYYLIARKEEEEQKDFLAKAMTSEKEAYSARQTLKHSRKESNKFEVGAPVWRV